MSRSGGKSTSDSSPRHVKRPLPASASTLVLLSDIRNELGGWVEDNLLQEMLTAVLYDHASGKDLFLWGTHPYGEGLLFLPVEAVGTDFTEPIARDTVDTWAEYWEMAGSAAKWGPDDSVYRSKAHYCKLMRRDDPYLTAAELTKRWREVDDGFKHPPRPGATFHPTDLMEWCWTRNFHEIAPPLDMARVPPVEIVMKYGRVVTGFWDGPYVEFPKGNGPDVVASLRRGGHLVVRDDWFSTISLRPVRSEEDARDVLERHEIYRRFREIVRRHQLHVGKAEA